MRYCYPFLALLILCQACSTAKKVPEIEPNRLPAVKFQGLGSKSVRLSVKNNRKVNEEVGNTAEVASSVRTAVTSALAKGGMSVSDKSPHAFEIQISDYTGSDADGECVKLTGLLRAKWGRYIQAEGYACHYLKHITGIRLGGDLSEAYEKALKMVLESLESNQNRLIGY